MPTLDPPTTALFLIDLQYGILAMSVAPHSADELLASGRDRHLRAIVAKAADVGAVMSGMSR